MTTRSGRFHLANLLAFWLMVASAWQVLAVDPVVSNVQVKQREGSRLVDITYDVDDPDSPTLTVYLKVSADGGKTWKGPVELVSGDVGQHIAPGTAKRLIWDAGKEMANRFGTRFRYRIGANDEWSPPDGMSLIKAGLFRMGSTGLGANAEHTVNVSAFAMDKWEVSLDLWESVRAWGNAHGYDLAAGDGSGAKHPVKNINWFDAVKWCNARSEKEGRMAAYYEDVSTIQVYRSGKKVPIAVKWDVGYRLPTEAEWEKAARGGVEEKLYPWGTDEISPRLANYPETPSDIKGTMPIGSYGANGYGLYDMAGNVLEWCWDWWSGEYSSALQIDPRGPTSGSFRVMRGGSWYLNAAYCIVWYRYDGGNPSVSRGVDSGFRCVLPPGQP